MNPKGSLDAYCIPSNYLLGDHCPKQLHYTHRDCLNLERWTVSPSYKKITS